MDSHAPKPGAPAASTSDLPSAPLESLIAQRRENLKRLTSQGINPYPYSYSRTHSVAALLKEYAAATLPEHGSEPVVRTAGRILTVRDMGKSCFAHIMDGSARLQIYVKKDVVGENT